MKGILTWFVSLKRRMYRPHAHEAITSSLWFGSGQPPTPAELWHAVPALDPRHHQHARTGRPRRRRSVVPLTGLIIVALVVTAVSVAIDVADAFSDAGPAAGQHSPSSAWLQLYDRGWRGHKPPGVLPAGAGGAVGMQPREPPLQVPEPPPLAAFPEDRFPK